MFFTNCASGDSSVSRWAKSHSAAIPVSQMTAGLIGVTLLVMGMLYLNSNPTSVAAKALFGCGGGLLGSAILAEFILAAMHTRALNKKD